MLTYIFTLSLSVGANMAYRAINTKLLYHKLSDFIFKYRLDAVKNHRINIFFILYVIYQR